MVFNNPVVWLVWPWISLYFVYHIIILPKTPLLIHKKYSNMFHTLCIHLVYIFDWIESSALTIIGLLILGKLYDTSIIRIFPWCGDFNSTCIHLKFLQTPHCLDMRVVFFSHWFNNHGNITCGITLLLMKLLNNYILKHLPKYIFTSTF